MMKFSFSAGVGRRSFSYCTLDDPGVNRRLTPEGPVPTGDKEFDELNRELWNKLHPRLRKLFR